MSVYPRSLLAVAMVVCITLLPLHLARAAGTDGIPCHQTNYLTKAMVLIGLDDLLVPIFTPGTTPDGLCISADFNGDGTLDLLVQGYTTNDETIIYLGNGSDEYSTVHQRWSNNGYWGVDWSANNANLTVADYNADGRVDIFHSVIGSGANTVFYSNQDSKFLAPVPPPPGWWELPVSGPSGTVVSGSTPGELAVANGAAQYSIPIEVPPGIAGMQPSVSINYNSMAGNGLVGVGGSISGLSAITRCPHSYAVDGYKRGVKFDSGDAFCMDGQRLMAVTNDAGASGQEYRTETESFTRVIAHNGAQGNPNLFVAETKSGLRMYFGEHASNDTRIEKAGSATTVLSWPVSRIEDRAGNYMHFIYDEINASGESYPSSIEYTGNGTQAPTRRVEFIYHNSRPVPHQGYVAGSPLQMKKLLKKVETSVGGDKVTELYLS